MGGVAEHPKQKHEQFKSPGASLGMNMGGIGAENQNWNSEQDFEMGRVDVDWDLVGLEWTNSGADPENHKDSENIIEKYLNIFKTLNIKRRIETVLKQFN